MLKPFLFTMAIVLFAYLYPHWAERWFHQLEMVMSSFARRRFAPWAVALLVLIGDVTLALKFLLPQPRIADEFSYLLNADTFVQGRLTNPPHLLRKHFESFHIIVQPTYNSKYPPMQGLFLALGQLAGHPIFGIWLSTALAGSALFWMLNAVFPKAWSLVGTGLALFNRQVLEWNWNYWGGTVPLLGGAILFGGFWRNLKAPAFFPSAAMGVGAGILALNRPFEGLVLCVLAGIALLASYLKNKQEWAVIVRQLVLPLVGFALPFLAFNGYYNFRVTGNALIMPYMVYENTYNSKSIFTLGSDRPIAPQFHNSEMRSFYKKQDAIADRQKTVRGLAATIRTKLSRYDKYFWEGAIMVFVFPLIAVARRNLFSRLACWLFLVPFAISLGLAVYTLPHYSAPIFPALLMALTFAVRELYGWSNGSGRWGRLAAQLLVVFVCLLNLKLFADDWRTSDKQKAWQYTRASLLTRLEGDGRKHLVLVKYAPKHHQDFEWVYNRADIDGAPVVWARDLGEEENRNVLNYFKDYQVLRLEVDDQKMGK